MNKRERRFVEVVWEHYRQQGRHDLPWRKTTNPYHILVSEVMLQQTQVGRVVPKYREFLKRFPTARRLATAPLGDVLRVWQGLGYNRRAKFLWQAALKVINELGGEWPTNELDLRSLPGVGVYTAAAIVVFAYNTPTVLIETNVRQVYLHHFFKNDSDVLDADILKLVKRTVPQDTAREWYWALMDYGSFLKSQHGNVNYKSKHYTKQSKFVGSDRQIRGAIIKVLSNETSAVTRDRLCERLGEVEPRLATEYDRINSQLKQLEIESFIIISKNKYRLV